MKHSDFDLRWHSYEPHRDKRCKQADSDCCTSKFCVMLISFLCALMGVKISCAYKLAGNEFRPSRFRALANLTNRCVSLPVPSPS
jgi:hypothetical protein